MVSYRSKPSSSVGMSEFQDRLGKLLNAFCHARLANHEGRVHGAVELAQRGVCIVARVRLQQPRKALVTDERLLEFQQGLFRCHRFRPQEAQPPRSGAGLLGLDAARFPLFGMLRGLGEELVLFTARCGVVLKLLFISGLRWMPRQRRWVEL